MRVNWKYGIGILMAGGIIYVSLASSKKELQPVLLNVKTEPQRILAAASSVHSSQEAKSGSAPGGPSAQVVMTDTKNAGIPSPEVIQKFKVIQAKVFKTPDDQKKLRQILSDSRYLLQLSSYLNDLRNIESVDFAANQNAVIDILLEALQSGDRSTAEQALFDIVKDAQIEDEKISFRSREILAGIKAEVLYQTSSIKPELTKEIEKLLPGQVSQKIWQNVQQLQSDNLALSEAEIERRIAQQNQSAN